MGSAPWRTALGPCMSTSNSSNFMKRNTNSLELELFGIDDYKSKFQQIFVGMSSRL